MGAGAPRGTGGRERSHGGHSVTSFLSTFVNKVDRGVRGTPARGARRTARPARQWRRGAVTARGRRGAMTARGHRPVLLDAVIAALSPRANAIYVDGTF